LLQVALNKAAMNELVLTVSEKWRLRLLKLAKEYKTQKAETSLRQTQTSTKSGAATDILTGSVRKKNKK